MSKIYESLKNIMFKAIAYKFEVRAQIYETLAGISWEAAHGAARDISRVVADTYSKKPITELKREELENSLLHAGFH